ncbi:hypothetical protein B0H11DRAFT_55684 [Mycena galericulata]|nr:hypothetical protein B0H11DRAFT_55684 [Mycena galericulata]
MAARNPRNPPRHRTAHRTARLRRLCVCLRYQSPTHFRGLHQVCFSFLPHPSSLAVRTLPSLPPTYLTQLSLGAFIYFSNLPRRPTPAELPPRCAGPREYRAGGVPGAFLGFSFVSVFVLHLQDGFGFRGMGRSCDSSGIICAFGRVRRSGAYIRVCAARCVICI